MKTFAWIIAIAAALAAGFWLGRRESGHEAVPEETAEVEVKPVAEVATARVRRANIAQAITAYGTIVAQPGNVRVLSMPFELRVAKVLVTAGEQVAAGDDVISIEPSPDTIQALQETRATAIAAEKELTQTEQRFKDQLATNAELLTAQEATEVAKLKLKSLTDRGAEKAQMLKAGATGVVNKTNIQEGQIVPAGGPLIEIASGNRIEAAVGVEPDDAAKLKVGQDAKLSAVGRTSASVVAGKIRLIAQRVDSATRLVSVIVTLPDGAHWMQDTYIAATFNQSRADALVVPREALLPQEGGAYALFTVKGNHAVKHEVRVGSEDNHDAELLEPDVNEGEAVVVTGNYELEDGMEVKAVPPTERAAAPATTEAAP
jgi:RND family efflux transporter MFP subunit